jgi:hypothetical protein
MNLEATGIRWQMRIHDPIEVTDATAAQLEVEAAACD